VEEIKNEVAEEEVSEDSDDEVVEEIEE